MANPQTEILVFVDGCEVARHVLGPGVHTIGCSPACGIRIEAELVSPRHAQLTVRDNGSLLLEDLGGANGTFLDGQTIADPAPVAPNQIIQLGAAQIVVLQYTIDPFSDITVAADGPAGRPEFSQAARYEIGAEIAKGGMGAVLSARQPAIRREVALKVMLREPSPHDRMRFIEEAQITGQLEHPNIVPVHDLAFNERGQPYYTMKLVKGSTLKEVLKLLAQADTATVAKYPLAALLTIFQKVCDAVAFAHARGVIHRDLKPANIMVGEYGEVLVMDWGLAKVLRADGAAPAANGVIASDRDDQHEAFATLDGAVMGTPQYMSPEQARGEVATLDQRSDIFSLGAILYELVALLPPFPGKTTRDILAKIKSGHFALPNARLRAADTPRPHHLPGGAIPDSLEAVILKALALDRDQRYQRVEEFQADLTSYQSGFATSAENAGPWRQFKLFAARHKGISTAVAASLLLIATIIAVFTSKVVAERNQTSAQRDRAEAERAKALEANAENLRHLHDASMADYAVARERMDKDGLWGEGVAQLARALDLEPKNPFPAMRLYGAILFGAPDKANLLRCVLPSRQKVLTASFSPDDARIVTASVGGSVQLWDAATGAPLGEAMCHGTGVSRASFSPDGTRIVTASEDKTARLWDAATGKPLGEPMLHEDRVRRASFSPDGSRILTVSGEDTARVWDAAACTSLGEPMFHDRIETAAFSPDGTRVVTASFMGTVQMWDAVTGKPVGETMFHEKNVSSASFSPDGSRILTASDDKTARVWDAATSKPIGEPICSEGEYSGSNFSATFGPDGTRIVTAGPEGFARLWNAATGKLIGEPMRHEKTIYSASFSPDGTRIVTASEDKTARLWDATTGKPLGEPMRHEDGVVSASFSHDGSRILTVSADRAVRLWEAATEKPHGEPIRQGNVVWGASFSPDGTRIVTACADKTARVWDAATGKPLCEPMRHENEVRSASFSPDGMRIVTASFDGTARVWDAATGKPLYEPMRHEGRVLSARFSPDGRRVVTSCDDQFARVWEAATGNPIGEPIRRQGPDASFSPDGTRILTASTDGTARIRDAGTGKPLGEPMSDKDTALSASFSSDGMRIVTATFGKTARVWDAATGKPLGEPIRHENVVWGANFSPDGARIVTACADKTARVWDVVTGKPLCEPMRHENQVRSASFSPDGTRIVTACIDGTARLWDVKHSFALPAVTPEWVREWARALLGSRFDANGVMQSMPTKERIRILYAPHADDDPWSRLARWVATDPAKRTIDPDSPHTFREIAERERDFGSRESFESALRYDTTVPLARLLLAAFEENPERAAFLREYDLKRLPDDATLWARATRALVQQNDSERAMRALAKLASLAPEQARQLKSELGL